jgi:hypothetical protein
MVHNQLMDVWLSRVSTLVKYEVWYGWIACIAVSHIERTTVSMSNCGQTLFEFYGKTELFEIFVAVAQFPKRFASSIYTHNLL